LRRWSEMGRAKIGQFGICPDVGAPIRKPMDDIKAVKWLSLRHAIEALTRAHEKVFLANVGPVALKAAIDESGKPYVYYNNNRRGQSARVAPIAVCAESSIAVD